MFDDDWAKLNTAPPPGSHIFQRTGTIFQLKQHIIKTNILTQLHEDWALNVTSTVFTSFELSRGINGSNVLTKFHEDRTINVASGNVTSRVFTSFFLLYKHTEKYPPPWPPGGHVFLPIQTIFELNRRIQEANVLTKCHSKELTCSNNIFLPTFMTSEHPGSYVFQQTRTIFIHIQDII
ncbi:hypothetical protein DPMN_137965 [Dreissena polymorpha]|uniref:Uncharacterized protein n=1 Tax=Dreissena polymorpha TaxID=45954 RepID=A0A9D4G683_DREPO|nr:hypothetical protein DPMN_137965 [Dreissena polymorpha]